MQLLRASASVVVECSVCVCGLCLVSLRTDLSVSEETRRSLTRELTATKTQLSSIEHQLNTVQQTSRQQWGVLSHAATTLTSLTDEINKVVVISSSDSTMLTTTTTTTYSGSAVTAK